jgi:hypothetical protein
LVKNCSIFHLDCQEETVVAGVSPALGLNHDLGFTDSTL